MAGTGVPGRAEGLLIPAFKSTSPNLSTSPLTRRFAFSTDSLLMQTGRALSLCAHNPAIHQVLYEVMGYKSMFQEGERVRCSKKFRESLKNLASSLTGVLIYGVCV